MAAVDPTHCTPHADRNPTFACPGGDEGLTPPAGPSSIDRHPSPFYDIPAAAKPLTPAGAPSSRDYPADEADSAWWPAPWLLGAALALAAAHADAVLYEPTADVARYGSALPADLAVRYLDAELLDDGDDDPHVLAIAMEYAREAAAEDRYDLADELGAAPLDGWTAAEMDAHAGDHPITSCDLPSGAPRSVLPPTLSTPIGGGERPHLAEGRTFSSDDDARGVA